MCKLYLLFFSLINNTIIFFSGRSDPPRIKTFLDKDTSHPPICYKSPLSRSSTRSRDPSPTADKSEKSTTSSSSSYLNPNRLYPKTYTRSTSRESIVSPTGSTSNLPRLSTNTGKRDEISKYGGSRGSSVPKESSISSRYKNSREDLTSGTPKYLNSRFLPKNSVERSFTAYSRPSSVRTHEVSRKNKELLSALHAQQEQEKLSSRPASRCSSVAPEEVTKKSKKASPEKERTPKKEVQFETVKVCTRGTSPTLGSSTQPSFLRSRRIELAKTIEKTITRAKTVKENMVDKEIQSDRLDDSTRSSRFAGATRISATPWTNFLDLKFSSPNSKKEKRVTQESTESPKSISRASSTKSIASVKSDKEKEIKKGANSNIKSKLTPPKQITDKKQLPPPIPKSESSSKPNSLHSLNTPNKDFRKSVLNMNPDGSKKKIGRRSNSASSAESDNADPDTTDISENLTSCKSYHNSSSSSRLPQKGSGERPRCRRSPSSDVSIGSTTGPSSSEDDSRSKKEKVISASSSIKSAVLTSVDDTSIDKNSRHSPKLKTEGNRNEAEAKNFLMRALAPVTNLFKPNKQAQDNGDNIRNNIGSNTDAEEKVIWILDPSSDSTNEQNSISLEPRNAKLVLHRVESDQKSIWEQNSENSREGSQLQQLSEPINMKYGEFGEQIPKQQSFIANSKKSGVFKQISSEEPWWLDSSQIIPEGVQLYSGYNAENNMTAPLNKPIMRHVESGEIPWWLDKNSEAPEGVQTYPNWTPQQESQPDNPSHQFQQEKPVIQHVFSGEKPWWLEENPSEIPEGVQVYPNWNPGVQTNQENSKYFEQQTEKQRIRPIESGEAPWWLKKDGTPPEGVHKWQTTGPNQDNNDNPPTQVDKKLKIRPIESGEAPWWLKKDSSPPEGVQTYPDWVSENTNSPKFKSNNSGNSPSESNAYKQSEFMEMHKLRHIDSGERAWWMNDDDVSLEMVEPKEGMTENKPKYAIRHQDSGERAWWLQDSHEFDYQEPLGDRASPEGLEMPKDDEGRLSPYDNVPPVAQQSKKNAPHLFISKHTNIDEILGGTGQLWSPLMNNIFGYQDEEQICREVDAREVIIHEGNAQGPNRG